MRNIKLMVYLNLIFFQVGLLESMMSALIPEMIHSFQVGYGLASVMPLAYYAAIALLCIPAGMIGSRYSSVRMLFFAFMLALAGVFMFVVFLSYQASVASLFLMGSAAAVMQVTAMPLVRKTCGAENLSFHTTLNQLMFGLGAFLSPFIYSRLTSGMLSGERFFPVNLLRHVVPGGFEWTSAYWLFVPSIISLMVAAVLVRFPEHAKDRSSAQTGKNGTRELFRNRYVIFFFVSMAAYASCEQGIAAWMSEYFQDVHGLDPLTEGASRLSLYWLLLTVGCLGGMLLLKFFESRKVLAVSTVCAIASLLFALHGGTHVSGIAFPLVAVFESVMWPVIMSLALNSVSRHHEVLSGFMFTAFIGGALGPVIIGSMGDRLGLGISLHYLFLPLSVVLSVAFLAKPLVNNKRITIKN
ncbi:MAG: MFS transporter [Bacteroidales bacterium]|jgi:fucose permease|nr:MFS transporter [Bacteroidales bacterium]